MPCSPRKDRTVFPKVCWSGKVTQRGNTSYPGLPLNRSPIYSRWLQSWNEYTCFCSLHYTLSPPGEPDIQLVLVTHQHFKVELTSFSACPSPSILLLSKSSLNSSSPRQASPHLPLILSHCKSDPLFSTSASEQLWRPLERKLSHCILQCICISTECDTRPDSHLVTCVYFQLVRILRKGEAFPNLLSNILLDSESAPPRSHKFFLIKLYMCNKGSWFMTPPLEKQGFIYKYCNAKDIKAE